MNAPGARAFSSRAVLAAAWQFKVRPPRVAASPVAFECTLDRIVTIGSGVGAGNVVFGRIVAMHVADSVLTADGKAIAAVYDADPDGSVAGATNTTAHTVRAALHCVGVPMSWP